MAKYSIRFILSLLLLSGFMAVIYTVMVVDNNYHEKYAHTIDVIGRQRMLSQRIVNFSNQLWACDLRACKPQAEEKLIADIRRAKKLFQQSYATFMAGKDDGKKLVGLNQAIYDISGIDRPEFNNHVTQFFGYIDRVISPDRADRARAMAGLNDFSEHFLIDIDILVKAYVVKADDVAKHMTQLQYLILLLLTGAIPVTVIILFRPLNKDLRKSYKELESQKNFMQTVISLMPDPLLIVTAAGDIRMTNKAAWEMFGWREKKLLKMNLSQLLLPDTRAKHGTMTRLFIEGSEDYKHHGKIKPRPVTGVKKSGEQVRFSISLARYIAPAGPNLGIAVIRDMSMMENLNEALEERIVAAHISRESKDRFIRNISHELRTPLNAVIGFSELLKSRLEIPDNQDYANNIHDAGLQLLEKFNQLIKVAAFEAGTEEIILSKIDLADYLDTMKSIWIEQIKDNDHTLEIGEFSRGLRVNINVDIFFYIMERILDNVNVHCPKGREVKIYQDKEKDGPCLVIEDNGDGVSPDLLHRIGSPFEKKGRKGLTAQKEGLALSLFLATQQMKAIGGRAVFNSEPGKGFSIKLCFQAATAAGQDKNN